jgi:sugar lactone lactonase YvrE
MRPSQSTTNPDAVRNLERERLTMGARLRIRSACHIAILMLAAGLMRGTAEAAAPPFPGATPNYKAWIEARLPGNAEGLAADSSGHLYASLFETGRIVRLDGKGGSETIATVPDAQIGTQGITLGMEFSHDGRLFVAFMWHYTPEEESDPFHPACRNSQDVYSGIYEVDMQTHTVKPFLTKRDGWPVCFPDDIAFDAKGNMYVTDLTLSGVWRITPDKHYSLWSSDPLLQWGPAPHRAFPEGANDLVMSNDGRSLYVVTDGNPAIVRVPIKSDGSAGPASLVVGNLEVLDGVDLDDAGNIYVSEVYREEISVFSPDGSRRIVIATPDTAPISNPTSLIYRNGVLCVANMGLGLTQKREPRSIACLSGFRRP